MDVRIVPEEELRELATEIQVTALELREAIRQGNASTVQAELLAALDRLEARIPARIRYKFVDPRWVPAERLSAGDSAGK